MILSYKQLGLAHGANEIKELNLADVQRSMLSELASEKDSYLKLLERSEKLIKE
jgi:hypothetical protein